MASICLNVGFNIPFIMKWGAIGAAWATLLAGIISGLISFMVAQHYYKIRWEYKNLTMIYSLFMGSSIFMILMRSYGSAYEVRFVLKFVFVAAYLFLGFKLSVITRENILLIKRMLTFKSTATPDNL
jgi:O-antigen/teichoic acid export membrane protein